ncbi:MAG: tRNA guanosine(15) transglycosylase TgtA [Desulfurococcaceae archaeon]
MFEVKGKDLAGRIGKLTTPHGALETPFLFPVVDPLRQLPRLSDIERIGFNGVITNAYLFYARNSGAPKSIHKELSWHNTIMTDSGGYQILVYGGVGVDNKTIVEYQKAIGTDIGVILDIPTGSKMSYEEAERSVYETYKRGVEALALVMDSEQLWTYPIQGAPFRELLLRSAIMASKLPYHIYAIGSPTLMLEKYEYSKLVELTALVRMHTPINKPLHVFGVGHPMVIPFLVAVGGDLFDSASYVLYARDGRYMTEAGTKDIRELSYFPCICPICSKYSPEDLLEMPSTERAELLAKHNLYMLSREIRATKQAIRENRLWELLEHRSRAHPSLLEAFEAVKRYIKFIDRHSPLTVPGGRATWVLSNESYLNPKIRLNARRAKEISLKDASGKVVVLVPAHKKPYTSQQEYLELLGKSQGLDNVKLMFLHPVLGVFTPGASSTFPFYQHECKISRRLIKANKIASFISEIAGRGAQKVIVVKTAWLSENLAGSIHRKLRERGTDITICRLDEVFSQILQ